MQLNLIVKPGSSQEKIVKTPADAASASMPNAGATNTATADANPETYIVYLRARPHDGEANAALIKLLSKHFHIPKTSIKITRGQNSRTKTVKIPSPKSPIL